MKNIKKITSVSCILNSVFCILLLSGCAQIVKPTGGPKDTIPPKAVSYSPENKSIHFNSHKILITFNKYIQLKDLQAQLVVSPPLKHFPKALVKRGKELELTLKDTLRDSTTYTFNFGKSIRDITEGNTAPNLHYVFSTGNYLDSLNLSGKLTDAFSQEAVKDGIVMLYADLSDSAPFKKLPYYYARSDENGLYKIENIKAGTYRVAALSKSGSDYFYHPYTESIGFSSKLLSIRGNDSANMELFTEITPKLRLVKATALEKGKILLAFNKSADSITIKPLNLPSDTVFYTYIQYPPSGDSVFYWLYTPRLDSLKFIVYRNKITVDTGNIFSFPFHSVKKKNVKLPPLRISLNVHDNQTDFDYHLPITVQSESPLAKYNPQKIYLTKRKDTIHFISDTSKLPFTIALKCSLMSDSSYHLYIAPGCFRDIFGLENDSTAARFMVEESTYFGSLKLNLKVTRTIHYIVQLLDENGKVFRQDIIKDTTASAQGGKGITIMYDALPPANYKIRVIEDDNNDGKWTTGNYLKNIQPEKVYYFGQPVTIRSNWDITQDWLVK